MRSFVRPAVVAIGALVLALSSTVPVSAMWTQSTVEGSWFLTRPSLQVDSTDHTGIAFERLGQNPGIFYATNATGSWVSSRVTSAEDGLPALRFDAAAHAHVTFARRSGTTGIYVTDDSTGIWATPSLVAADLDPSFPSLAIDGLGHMAIAYTSTYSFAPGLYVVSNATGSWVKTRLTAATWDGTTSIQLDATGHAHVMFVRYSPDDPGVYYATNATGSWVITRLTTSFDDNASFVFDGAGKIHSTFRRIAPGPEASFYATNATGGWVIEQLPYHATADFGAPTIALDPSGTPNVFVSIHEVSASNPGGHLFHYVRSNGSWVGSADIPDDDAARDDDFPSLGFLSNGTIQMAFRRIYPSAGLRLYAFATESSLIAGSNINAGPSVDLGPSGERAMAWSRRTGNQGETSFATGTGNGWTIDLPGAGNPARSATDLAVDSVGAIRIVDGASSYTNASSAWVNDLTLPYGSESEVEVDGSGYSHVIASDPIDPYWVLDYRTNAGGTWTSENPFAPYNLDGDPEPSLALDAAGRPHIAWVEADGAGGAFIAYQNRVSGTWTTVKNLATGSNAWPSIGVDGAGKVHIAYIHYGSAPGIYYATNKSGTWVTTRLTRSYAEGAPSLAIDGAGHVYVATTRASWAADPGVFVMTNATGAWVVARVVATESAGDVSLAVTSGGLARMVFVTDQGVLEYEDSVTAVSVQTNGALTNVLRSQLAASVGKTTQPGEAGSSPRSGPAARPATAPRPTPGTARAGPLP